MGMADTASLLWMKHLKHNPADSKWHDRDRFVLSAGHGSMLLYSLLHLTGYDLELNELKNFRQLGSQTPGHPEYAHTDGVETTTGPLGQGLANAVGMALAEQKLAAKFNTADHKIVDHHTYVITGDGCLEEGLSHEVCSLAGTLKLGKLILLYDDNNITIDGPTELSFTEDVLARFGAYDWHTQRVDGHDIEAVDKAINAAKKDNRPSIIACKTTIGFGSPNKAGTSGVHGSPLGAEELALAKEALGLPKDQPFYFPEEVKTFCRSAKEKGTEQQKEWQKRLDAFAASNKSAADEFTRTMNGQLPANWENAIPVFPSDPMATRTASGKTLDEILPELPELFGGSADLTPSDRKSVV